MGYLVDIGKEYYLFRVYLLPSPNCVVPKKSLGG